MSSNKKVIEEYLASADRSKVASLLADDVEWVEWGEGVTAEGLRHRGKEEFLGNFGEDELRTEIVRLTEEDPVVVAEGIARVYREGRHLVTVRFCDIFELEHGKVKRLSSFGALLKEPA